MAHGVNEAPSGFNPFAGPAIEATAVSTAAQREVWLAAMSGTDASLAFNECAALRLTGVLDVEALLAAVEDVVARHEGARLTFSPDGLTMIITEPGPVAVPIVDLTPLPRAEREAACIARHHAEVVTPFDLVNGPLLRFVVIRIADECHELIVSAHHAALDGFSLGVLAGDLAVLYGARVRGEFPVLPPADRLTRYAATVAELATGADFAIAEAYWLGRFSTENGALPVLELPTDRPRPAMKTYAAAREDHVLAGDVVAAIKAVALRERTSLVVTMMAGFAALLNRLSGQDDVVIGLPAAGQAAFGFRRLVGHCVNLLPLRLAPAADKPFRALLVETRAAVLDGANHQALGFGSLLQRLPIARDPSRLPLVSVMFNVDKGFSDADARFEGLRATLRTVPRVSENFDVFINGVEEDGRLTLECQYNTDLFDRATIRRWLAAFEQLLRALPDADLDAPLGALPAVAPEERALLDAVNAATAREVPPVGVHELIAAQAARTPGATAVVSDAGAAITYAELERDAARVAAALTAHGVGAGALVGLAVERTPAMLAGLLGVLKAGAAYVPLDPAFPRERLAYMAEDAGLAAIVTSRAVQAELGLDAPHVLLLDDVLTDASLLAGQSASVTPDDAAYVIYTSGSTGKPKGVVVPHGAVVNFLASMQEAPGIARDARMLAVTTLSFDIAVLELLLPLTVGAQVVLATRETASDGAALRALVERAGVTMMQATPATYRLLLGAGWTGGSGVTALVGGEALPRDLAQELTRRVGALWNMYGPTETTVWSTCWRVPADFGAADRVLIGTPIANTRVYVLDAAQRPLPIGATGELWIGGAGVTLGYHRRPELTAERFVADPTVPGALMYRTGDLARLQLDGTLECLGRTDFQVKLRGYRIELGEIEHALAAHAAVGQAVVAVREIRPGDAQLVAYLVPAAGATLPEPAELRALLKATLPEYMIPQAWMTLATLPLTPNGKVDRKALPAPDAEAALAARAAAFVAPRSPTETLLAGLWADALAVSRVSIVDDFFALGGHSLLALQVLTRLEQETGIRLPFRRMLEASTIEQLASVVDAMRAPAGTASDANPLRARVAGLLVAAGASGRDRAPTTDAQREVWTAVQMGQDASRAYNLAATLRLAGTLDATALRAAASDVAARHEALRATISEDGLEMRITPSAEAAVAWTELDLRALDAGERLHALAAHRDRVADEPFDLERGPLARWHLVRMADDEHLLTFAVHHIVCDGWSMNVVFGDLAAFYNARVAGTAVTLPPAEQLTQYADALAAAAGSDVVDRAERYWIDQFAPARGALPVLELPTDRARPPLKTFAAARVDRVLDAALVDRLRRAGARERTSLFATMLAGFGTLLNRLSGQDDLVVGVPAAGQAALGYPNLVGHCVNLLPVRLFPGAARDVREFLGDVRAATLDAVEHQPLTFGRLLQRLSIPRDPSRQPLVSVMLNVDPGLPANLIPFVGLAPSWELKARHYENFDLYLNCRLEEGGGLRLACQYNTDLFDRQTIDRWLAAYELLLVGMLEVLETGAAGSLGALPVVTPAEQALLESLNAATTRQVPRGGVHELIAAQAARTPEAIAVVSDAGASITYAALEAQAGRIAAALRARGVGRGSRVGLAVERTPAMLVGLLGILKTGAAYVPLDPNFPSDRLAYMVEDAALAALVTEQRVQRELRLPVAEIVWLDDVGTLAASSDAPAEPVSPTDAAYVIYTSGSTGKPKGVVVPHGAVVNFLASMQEVPGLSAADRVLAVTTLSFDIAVLELLLPLTVGAQVVLATRETASDGAALRALVERAGVTMMQATPATYRLLLGAGWTGGSGITALVGGEALPKDVAATLAGQVGALWNMYGPTETTVWSTCWRVPADFSAADRVLIGTPIANTAVYVLDAQGRPAPLGGVGELWIGGAGVTLGYHDRPALTEDRFRPDPFAVGRPGARMYRTGDLARLRTDGTLECLGRTDFQVKVRGYRIELGEIEHALTAHASVGEAAVIVREDRPGDVRLVAYVVDATGAERGTDAQLRSHLKTSLPDYMIPQTYVHLAALPLTPNGKVDRKALPAPRIDPSAVAEHVAPRTPTETLVAGLWADALGLPQVSVEADFFSLGGHSLLAAQVLARLRRDHGIELSYRKVFEASTVGRMAAVIDAVRAEGGVVRQAMIPRRANRGPAPLAVLQERFWLLEQLDPRQRKVYNNPLAWRMDGPVDAALTEAVLREQIRRHDALRTAIRVQDGVPMQEVLDDVAFHLGTLDLSSLPDAMRADALQAFYDEQEQNLFDLSRPPLLRACLIRLAPEQHLLWTLHHNIVWDGWSNDLFMTEFCTIYAARAAGREPVLPALPIGFVDFATWQREYVKSAEMDRKVAWWREQLKGELPVMDLPGDRPRPEQPSYDGAQLRTHFTAAEAEALTALAREQGATLFMVLFAAYAVLLHRYSGLTDVLVSTPMRARTREELEHIIGPVVNSVVLRTRVEPEQSFSALVRQVLDFSLDAMHHQEMPFELLGGKPPVVRTTFSLQDARTRPMSMGDIRVSHALVGQKTSPNDLAMWMLQKPDGLTAILNYSTDLFDAETALQISAHFRAILLSALEAPNRPVSQIKLLDDVEQHEILVAATPVQPDVVPLPERIRRLAAAAPARVAVSGPVIASRQDIERRALAIAGALTQRGISAGAVVGVAAQQVADRAAALYGVLQSGAAALLIDDHEPAAYVAALLRAAGAKCLLADTPDVMLGTAPEGVVLLALSDAVIAGQAGGTAPAAPDALALLLHETGPDAVPEIYPVTHARLAALVDDLARLVALDEDDVVGALLSPAAHAAALELLAPLALGASILGVDPDLVDDGHSLGAALTDGGVTLALAPQATWRRLLDDGFSPTDRFRAVITDGPVVTTRRSDLLSRLPSVFAAWGDARTGLWATLDRVSAEDQGARIGRPLSGTGLVVRQTDGAFAPPGVWGALRVVLPEVGEQDLGLRGRRRRDGAFELAQASSIGPLVRGLPVDVRAVEAVLREHPAVAHAVVTINREGETARVVAYVVAAPDRTYTDTQLRTHVRRLLPRHCVPSLIVELSQLPLDAEGNVDRTCLPSPVAGGLGVAFVSPRDDEERLLERIWRGLLGVERIGVYDNFFNLGGYSLLCFQAVAAIERETQVRLSPRLLLLGTLEQVAVQLRAESAALVIAADGRELGASEEPSDTRGVLSKLRTLFGRG